jgi:hypothetical protein
LRYIGFVCDIAGYIVNVCTFKEVIGDRLKAVAEAMVARYQTFIMSTADYELSP